MNHVIFSFFLVQIDWRVASQDTIWYSVMSSSAGKSNWTQASGNCRFSFESSDNDCPTSYGSCFRQCGAKNCPGGSSYTGYIYRNIPTTGYKDIYLEYTICGDGGMSGAADCRIYYNQNNQGNSNWNQFYQRNLNGCDTPNTKYYLPSSADNNPGVGIKFYSQGDWYECCSYEHIALKGTPITNSPTTSEPTTRSPTYNPSKNPTNTPTSMPTTSIPTTSIPTYNPSRNPTQLPTTVAPTTEIPTYTPTTTEPTSNPTTSVPTTKIPTYTINIVAPTVAPAVIITTTLIKQIEGDTSTTSLVVTNDNKTLNEEKQHPLSTFIYLAVGVGGTLCILNAILCVIFVIKKQKKRLKQKENLKKSQDSSQKSIMMASMDTSQKPKVNGIDTNFAANLQNLNGANNLLMDDVIDDIELIGKTSTKSLNIQNNHTPPTNEDNYIMGFSDNIATKRDNIHIGTKAGYNDNLNTESEGTGTQTPTDDIVETVGNLADDEFIVNDDEDDNNFCNFMSSQQTLTFGKTKSDEFILNGHKDDNHNDVVLNEETDETDDDIIVDINMPTIGQ